MKSLETLALQVQQAAASLGLAGGSYKLIRAGTNDVFVDEKSGVVARVAPDYISQDKVRANLLDCQELSVAGAPILAPLTDEVVVLTDDRHVSFWPLAQIEIELNGREMAEVLTACHRLPPPARLTDWTPDLFVDRRWATLKAGVESGLPSDMADSLSDMFTEALDTLKEICRQRYSSASSSFIWGDTHHSNFVRYQGCLVLCDPDNICRGPREKDLANVLESCRRGYINPRHWKQFTAAYPLDYNQELLEALRRVQETGGCMFMSQFWGSRPESQPAIAHNIETIDQPTAQWLDI